MREQPEVTMRERDLAREILASVAQAVDAGLAYGEKTVGAVSSALARYRLELDRRAAEEVCTDLALLSGRELDVVERLREGKRPADIARELQISANTVRGHLKRIYRKVGVNSQVQLLAAVRGADQHG